MAGIRNLIAGTWQDSSTNQTFENKNPADTAESIGIITRSGKEDVGKKNRDSDRFLNFIGTCPSL